MSFSAEDKRTAVEREIAYRRRVYPKLVEQGKIKQTFADRQIAIFEAIAADYEKLAGEGRLL